MEDSNSIVTLERLSERANKANHFARRRSKNTTIVLVRKTSGKKQAKIFQNSMEYTFLQYLPLAYNWALTSYPNLTREDLDIMLYIAPLSVVSDTDYQAFSKHIKPLNRYRINKMVKKGWMVLWRKRSKGHPALFSLSRRGWFVCNALHRMCAGEKKIPEIQEAVPTSKREAKNQYYTSVIKRLNKKPSD